MYGSGRDHDTRARCPWSVLCSTNPVRAGPPNAHSEVSCVDRVKMQAKIAMRTGNLLSTMLPVQYVQDALIHVQFARPPLICQNSCLAAAAILHGLARQSPRGIKKR